MKNVCLKILHKVIGITKLYSNTTSYNVLPINQEISLYENGSFSVIGLIDIKKVNISYPILSSASKKALKIGTCRFYGPLPNEVR